MFYSFLRRFGLLSHYGIGVRDGKMNYPGEEQGIELPLFAWDECQPAAEANSSNVVPSVPSARPAPLQSVA